ncbi:MAG: hypothetical protein M3X11_04900 [Acidobacteriota bacterium]|nr:hypothetical protein [Acidobacteriota bacterium]
MPASKLAILESRLETVEAEITQLKQHQMGASKTNGLMGDAWIDKIYGAFADDPDYDKAMELGRKYRESLRLKPARKKAKKTAKRPAL